MAEPIIPQKRCCRCKQLKPFTDFLNPSATRILCATCRAERPSANTNSYVETTCLKCGAKRQQRTDVIKVYPNQLCRKCSSQCANSRPEIKSQRIAKRLQTISEWTEEKKTEFAEHARQQVLRQGGVPNAKKFVNEGEVGRRMAGEAHYAWKGGITPETQRERSSGKCANWRKAILIRDNFTCQLCGIRGGKLQADHILAWSTHPELRFELSNGRTLCVPCHKSTPNYGWRGRSDYVVS